MIFCSSGTGWNTYMRSYMLTRTNSKREAVVGEEQARSYCICCMTAMFSMTSLSMCRFLQLISPCDKCQLLEI